MRSLALIALVAVTLLSSGCGSSSTPANTAIYTVTPNGGLESEIYVTFTGPAAAARKIMRAFEATHKGYMIASTASGQTNCGITARSGKVTLSVVTAVGSNASLSKTMCNSISRQFY